VQQSGAWRDFRFSILKIRVSVVRQSNPFLIRDVKVEDIAPLGLWKKQDNLPGVSTPGYFIPNGHGYSAAATGRFDAARIRWVRLPYIAAVIKLLLEAGG
jgi:hypothetical protein